MKASKKSAMSLTGNQEKRLDLVFGAIADATRRSMLDRLRSGSLTVTELARPYAMSLNAVSKHVKTLERAGLIHRTIKGREHFCRLDAARLEEAMNWMSYYSEFWSARMDALEKHLVEKRKRGAK
jgi:DNA-binding transcriptional ArsR family regulator